MCNGEKFFGTYIDDVVLSLFICLFVFFVLLRVTCYLSIKGVLINHLFLEVLRAKLL